MKKEKEEYLEEHLDENDDVYVILEKREIVKVKKLVAELVLETFVGPKPEGKKACHKDNDKTNNRVENLYWG